MVYVILRASFVLLSMITKLVNNSFLLCQLFLDDSERNIAAGKALGLRTALVINHHNLIVCFSFLRTALLV